MKESVFIPEKIFKIKHLGWREKIVLSYILQEQGDQECTEVTNQYLADVFDIHMVQISKYISRLEEMGMVERTGHNRNRKLRVLI